MNAKKPSVYVLPCAIQSHINPMLHFSKCLASNTNLNVTFFIPTNSKKSTLNLPPNTSITYQFIPNGFEETQEPLDNEDNTQCFKDAVSKHVTEFLIEQRKSSHFCPKIIVYDSILPWVLGIAHQLSLLGASFFMQSCSVSTIYFHIKQGLLRFPFEDQLEVELPFLPKLGASDLPTIDNVMGSSHTIIQLLADQFLNLEKADFVLFNSFDELEIVDMFAAGTDTTFTLIEWSLSELIRHRKIMAKLRTELRNIAGCNSTITEENLDKCQYLKAVIKESLRLHPPLPLLVPRESTHDVQLLSYDIAAGTRVVINAWAIGRDPSVWQEAEEFLPERFLNSSVDFKGQFQFIPFGAGRRGCPGAAFALGTVELVLANLVLNFEFALPGEARGEDLDMLEGDGLTIHRKFPLSVIPFFES